MIIEYVEEQYSLYTPEELNAHKIIELEDNCFRYNYEEYEAIELPIKEKD